MSNTGTGTIFYFLIKLCKYVQVALGIFLLDSLHVFLVCYSGGRVHQLSQDCGERRLPPADPAPGRLPAQGTNTTIIRIRKRITGTGIGITIIRIRIQTLRRPNEFIRIRILSAGLGKKRPIIVKNLKKTFSNFSINNNNKISGTNPHPDQNCMGDIQYVPDLDRRIATKKKFGYRHQSNWNQ